MSLLSLCGRRYQAGRREPEILSSSLSHEQNTTKSRAAAGGEALGAVAENPGNISRTAPGQDMGAQQKPVRGGKDTATAPQPRELGLN